jgi:23S rRNA U2552 (ribose-2'-O)-methylase RlmE/FtsJ
MFRSLADLERANEQNYDKLIRFIILQANRKKESFMDSEITGISINFKQPVRNAEVLPPAHRETIILSSEENETVEILEEYKNKPPIQMIIKTLSRANKLIKVETKNIETKESVKIIDECFREEEMREKLNDEFKMINIFEPLDNLEEKMTEIIDKNLIKLDNVKSKMMEISMNLEERKNENQSANTSEKRELETIELKSSEEDQLKYNNYLLSRTNKLRNHLKLIQNFLKKKNVINGKNIFKLIDYVDPYTILRLLGLNKHNYDSYEISEKKKLMEVFRQNGHVVTLEDFDIS